MQHNSPDVFGSAASAMPMRLVFLAPDDLRDPLVAQPQDLGDGFHREILAVGISDGLISFVPQLLGLFVQLDLAPLVLLREGLQTSLGLRRVSYRAGNPTIVRCIPTNRLAQTVLA